MNDVVEQVAEDLSDLQDRLPAEENPGLGSLNEIEDYLHSPETYRREILPTFEE